MSTNASTRKRRPRMASKIRIEISEKDFKFVTDVLTVVEAGNKARAENDMLLDDSSKKIILADAKNAGKARKILERSQRKGTKKW